MAGLLHPIHIVLADDDPDDALLFREVLEDLHLSLVLSVVYDGEQLIELLNEIKEIPDILFLDLNMPRKNGLDCLSAIKQTHRLRRLPVVIFSTSYVLKVVDHLYNTGAQYYIRKPTGFAAFKNVIQQALVLTDKSNVQPSRDKFELLS